MLHNLKHADSPFAGYRNLVGLGVSVTSHPDWASFTEAPKAHGNYKDPAKIQEYLDAAAEKLRQTAAERLLTTRITEVAVCLDLHKPCTVYKAEGDQKEFAKSILTALFPSANTVGYLTTDRALLSSLILDVLTADDSKREFSDCLVVPYFEVMRGLFDPCIGGEEAYLLAKRLNITVPEDLSPACRSAWLSLALGKKLGYPLYTAQPSA